MRWIENIRFHLGWLAVDTPAWWAGKPMTALRLATIKANQR